jgi:flagellar biosynthesis/type III secretory pathway chaperone
VSEHIAALKTVLVEKQGLLECLSAVIEEENRYVVELDSSPLASTSARKEQVFEKIARLNEKCRTVLESTNQELGLPRGSSLSQVVGRLKSPERDVLRSLQEKLIVVAKKNEQLLALNKELLESSLSLIDRSMKFFSGLLNSGGTYGMSGRMLDVPSAARLVCKEM